MRFLAAEKTINGKSFFSYNQSALVSDKGIAIVPVDTDGPSSLLYCTCHSGPSQSKYNYTNVHYNYLKFMSMVRRC